MVNLTSFLMIYTFIILSLIIKELEANEISTLKSFWCILNHVDTQFYLYQHFLNSTGISSQIAYHVFSVVVS